jgi:DNA-binding MarR family transcriptional regulator
MTTHKFNLTAKQAEILEIMQRHQRVHGIVPTQVQVAKILGVKQATVAKHIAALERRGWVARARGLKNGLVIL